MKKIGKKNIAKISEEILGDKMVKTGMSQEQLQREFNYIQAENVLKKMFEKELINEAEFDKITELNRKTFSPFLAKIMP